MESYQVYAGGRSIQVERVYGKLPSTLHLPTDGNSWKYRKDAVARAFNDECVRASRARKKALLYLLHTYDLAILTKYCFIVTR